MCSIETLHQSPMQKQEPQAIRPALLRSGIRMARLVHADWSAHSARDLGSTEADLGQQQPNRSFETADKAREGLLPEQDLRLACPRSYLPSHLALLDSPVLLQTQPSVSDRRAFSGSASV